MYRSSHVSACCLALLEIVALLTLPLVSATYALAEYGASTSADLHRISFDGVGSPSDPGACVWASMVERTELEGVVLAATTFDAGDGPHLYVGGSFEQAGGRVVNRLARWQGDDWAGVADAGGQGTDGTIRALAVFDDGGGEALYAAGEFATAGGQLANHIARWDGATWSVLTGPEGTGTDGPISALAVFDDGSGPALYVGGSFIDAGGLLANRIARWDGAAWSVLETPEGIGTNGGSRAIETLEVFDDGSGPALYVGGFFTAAGGLPIAYSARWDGSGWTALGGGTNGPVSALEVFDDGSGPALYAGGFFEQAEGAEVGNIAKWDGLAWSALETADPGATPGTDNAVAALRVYDAGGGPALYVGGFFTSAGGLSVGNIAAWDGRGWSALGAAGAAGTDGDVLTLTVFGDALGEGETSPMLFVGGELRRVGGLEVDGAARWQGEQWSAFVRPTGPEASVTAMISLDRGDGAELYAGGDFAMVGETFVGNIARWDGQRWRPLEGAAGTGTDGPVRALAVWDDGGGPALYVGGEFTMAGGLEVNGIARWDGSTWSSLDGPLGTGTDAGVLALAVFDQGGGPALYAGGYFSHAGGASATRVARWDGSGWAPLPGAAGEGVDGTVATLSVFDAGFGAELIAGGSFDHAAGVPANNLARWDGLRWAPLEGAGIGGGTDGAVLASVVYDPDGEGDEPPELYVGGELLHAGGQPASYIARWNGADWSALQGSLGSGTSNVVRALEVFDHDRGPALFVAGDFAAAGGSVVDRIARWDGGDWSALPGPATVGTSAGIDALAGHDDGNGPSLYAGGRFLAAGGAPAIHVGHYFCPPLDYGDAPEPGYPTRARVAGARHTIEAGFHLGSTVDADTDGEPHADALGDDHHPTGSASDEDGISFPTPLIPGQAAEIEAVVEGSGRLDAWIDWNVDGSWSESERVLDARIVDSGNQRLEIQVPADAAFGVRTFARFRLSPEGADAPTGSIRGGEVEDYSIFVPAADLLVSQVHGASTVVPGEFLIYTITATNLGPSAVGSANLEELFPPSLSCTWTGQAADGAEGPLAGSGDLRATLSLPVGGSMTYLVICRLAPDATGAVVSTVTLGAQIPDPDLTNNSASTLTDTTPVADLAVTLDAGVDSILPGQDDLVYTLTASNLGPSHAPITTLLDVFPSELTCAWTSIGTGGASGHGAGAGQLDERPVLPVGSSAIYDVDCTVDVSASGVLVNTATLGSSIFDPDPSNNSASEETVVDPVADLEVVLEDSQDPAAPGGPLVLTATVSNLGPTTAIGATLASILPDALILDSTTGCSNDPMGVPSCALGDLDTGASITVTYSGALALDTPSGSLSTTVTVDSDRADVRPANDQASEETWVDAEPPTVTTVTVRKAEAIDDAGNIAEIEACDESRAAIRRLGLGFSKRLHGSTTDAAYYRLRKAGIDQDLTAASCDEAIGDDEEIPILDLDYDDTTRTVLLTLGEAEAESWLADGLYRLLVCADAAIHDAAGNSLDGDGDGTAGDDFVRSFRVSRQNLFDNGHFDCDVDRWTLAPPVNGTIGWAIDDADDADASGSMSLVNTSELEPFTLDQCRPATPGVTYRLRGLAWVGSASRIQVDTVCEFFPSVDCTGDDLGQGIESFYLIGPLGQWQPVELESEAPLASRSMRCGARVRSLIDETFEVLLDRMTLEAEGVELFADGFESADISTWSDSHP